MKSRHSVTMTQFHPPKDAAKESEFEHQESLSPPPLHAGVDKELSQYVSDVAVDIPSDRNKELLRKIDKRVLPVLIVACLLQALSQSTLPFASIMGLIKDTGLQRTDGSTSQKV